MDWTKTKTILIIALTLTNLVLGLFLFSQKRQEAVRWNNEKEALLDMRQVLEERDIYLGSNVTFEDEKAIILEVAYQVFDPLVEGERFLKNAYQLDDNIVSKGLEKVVINDALLQYINENYEEESLTITENEAAEQGRTYLKTIGFWEDGVYLAEINKDTRSYELTYKQLYDNKFVENSYMRLKVVNQGIQELERKWFDIVRVDKTPVAIIPASKALFYLIDKLYNEDPDRRSEVYIQSVDLGYRLDTSVFSSPIYSGEVSPFWRIKTESGNEFFIKALE